MVEHLESGVVLVRLGVPGEHPLLLSTTRLQSLAACIMELQAQPPAGLVIASPDAEMFCAGLDVALLGNQSDAAQAAEFTIEVQKLFSAIAALPCPTVAAISGPCVGGGCELALACRHRIITDTRSSVIGLPEIKLGIIPAFGGTERLPQLVGVRTALDMILSGRLLQPQQARVIGLVDDIVPYHTLLKYAEDVARGAATPVKRVLSLSERWRMRTKLGRSAITKRAEARIAAETHGRYPAPQAALKAVMLGLAQGQAAGGAFAAAQAGKLLATPECKKLVRLFFLGEAAKSIGRAARHKLEHVQVLVQGADAGGADLAATLAKHECSAILQDSSEQSLQAAEKRIDASIARMRYCGDTERSFVRNRIELAARDSMNLGNVTFAVDMLADSAQSKQKRLIELAEKLPHDVIIAVTSPELALNEASSGVPQRERVVGLRFFEPIERVPLVEIVGGRHTSDRTLAIAAAVTVKMGKYPVVVMDRPGALVYRMLVPYFNEALWLLSEGVPPATIESAAIGFGMRSGPLAFMDQIGLGVVQGVLKLLRHTFADRLNGPDYLDVLLAHDRGGRRNGGGFYDCSRGESSALSPKLRSLLALPAPKRGVSDSEVEQRLVLAMVNEAVRCLDDAVAGTPGAQAAGQIDLASVMAAGFPSFRGGVLQYADDLSVAQVLKRFEELQKTFPRFRPAEGVSSRAASGRGFCR